MRYGTYTTKSYITDESRLQTLVTRVMKLERLRVELIPILKEIGLPNAEKADINRRDNEGPKDRHYSEYYNKATVEYVREKWADDIETYGYRFGE